MYLYKWHKTILQYYNTTLQNYKIILHFMSSCLVFNKSRCVKISEELNGGMQIRRSVMIY